MATVRVALPAPSNKQLACRDSPQPQPCDPWSPPRVWVEIPPVAEWQLTGSPGDAVTPSLVQGIALRQPTSEIWDTRLANCDKGARPRTDPWQPWTTTWLMPRLTTGRW